MTVHAWLRRLGYLPPRTLRHKPLGWSTPATLPTEPVWQVDFKEKGGPRT
jgi:hypothetical protein